jgi:tetratricopeptide (TPR) repeat protein
MIIKDSGEPLKKVLESVKPHIDSWCIVDTGSTDGSQEIVKNVLSSIPGKIYEEQFVDFSTTRNRAFELAETCGIDCEYNIVLDDSYILYGGCKLRNIIGEGNLAAYSIIIKNKRMMYESIRITKVSEKLRYKYRVHEDIIVSKKKLKIIINDDVYIEDIECNTHSVRSNDRYKNDLTMLLQDYRENPKNMRIIFYIAQTYNKLGNHDKAIFFYNKRIQIDKKKDTSDEVYNSYYNLGHIYKLLYNWNKAEQNFMFSYNLRPYRAEPIYHITKYYFENNKFDKALLFLNNLIKLKLPSLSIDTCEIEHIIYFYDIPYLLAEVLIRKGDVSAGLQIVKQLLTKYPENNDLKNILYGIEKQEFTVKKYHKKVIVMHACNLTESWCPTNYIGTGVSGSEIMAMNMAIQFAKNDYKVFLFTKCENLEGVYDNVEYLHYTKYENFLQETYINYLIVLRDPNNLKYYEHIEQVYFWIHDILPIGSQFQTHANKFKKIVSLTNWHKKELMKEYNFPSTMISVIGNSVTFDRDENVKKIPYRFIYSSDFIRGFDKLLRLFPKIKERYPLSELYAFISKKYTSPYDYVHIKGRITQKELMIEYKKSDIWFYPTDFQETYCITALEAQLSKCICVCSDLAGLKDTVGDRGVLFDNSKSDDYILEKLFTIIDDTNKKEELIQSGYIWAMQQSNENIVKKWIDMF